VCSSDLAEPAAEADPFSEAALDQIVPGDMPYRDAQKLRNDLAKFRDQYKPIHETFGGLDDTARTSFMEASKHLGADVARVADVFARLHPDDRAYFIGALGDLASTDPAVVKQAAVDLQRAAAIILGNEPPPDAAPPAPAPSADDLDDDPDRPLTQADLDAYYERRRQEEAYERQQADLMATIQKEIEGLGYDFEKAKNDPIEQWRIAGLLDVARTHFDGDIAKAHAVADAWRQQEIDAFVAAKSADAGRISSPADAGAAPHAEPTPNETIETAERRLEERLDAEFGPDPRGRR